MASDPRRREPHRDMLDAAPAMIRMRSEDPQVVWCQLLAVPTANTRSWVAIVEPSALVAEDFRFV